jgi:hypothetical protein
MLTTAQLDISMPGATTSRKYTAWLRPGLLHATVMKQPPLPEIIVKKVSVTIADNQ